MQFKAFVVLAISMAIGIQAQDCIPDGSNGCDLSGNNNCCSGNCDKPADWEFGVCLSA